LTCPGKSLLDYTTADVRIDKAAVSACDSFAQFRICNFFFACKPFETAYSGISSTLSSAIKS
jgi:hypothetical protein